jgi:hypothetical protein
MKEIQTKRTPRFRRWCRKGYAAFASLRRQVTIGVLSVSMSTILLSTTTPVQAQTVDSLTIARELEIETVEVTGVKATPTRSAMSSTSVFDRKAGASAPVQTLESVLRLSPAIDLRERSGRGTQADIMIRGGSFDQTMVMLNGINFTDARTGHQSHSLPIDIDCIAGIDLIDGVSGVGAYAGALNIRTMPLKSRYLRIEAAGGDDGYAYGNLSGAVTKGRFSLFAAGSYRRSDGYIHNTDFENYNGYLRMNYDSEKAGFFDFQAGYQNRSFGSNGFYAAYNPDQFEHTSTVLSSLRWVKSVGRFTLNSSVSYRKNFDRYDWTRGTPMNHHNTDNAGAEFWADCTWKGGVTSLGGDYTYHYTEAGFQKRFWFSAFGYTDIILKAGKVWNKVPFPLLIIPNANLSYTIQPESYSLMNAMEFMNDEYASWDVTYYLNGFVFNRIPLLKKLKWREVLSCRGLYGNLSDKNNPALSDGLFRFPAGSTVMGHTPYVEVGAGIENILKVLRVDYVWRLTYRNLPNIDKSGLRISLHMTF